MPNISICATMTRVDLFAALAVPPSLIRLVDVVFQQHTLRKVQKIHLLLLLFTISSLYKFIFHSFLKQLTTVDIFHERQWDGVWQKTVVHGHFLHRLKSFLYCSGFHFIEKESTAPCKSATVLIVCGRSFCLVSSEKLCKANSFTEGRGTVIVVRTFVAGKYMTAG